MTPRKIYSIATALLCVCVSSQAASVKVEMNTTSKTMTLQSKENGTSVETGSPSGTTYSFDVAPGEYVLTAYSGNTVNGSIDLTIADSQEIQEFKVITSTIYATNTGWTLANGDYTIQAKVNSREGKNMNVTLGESTTANRSTMLSYVGNSYTVEFIPSAGHQAEGYTSLYKMGTLTAGINISGAIPKGGDFTISIPADAHIEIGMKKAHFTDFTAIQPTAISEKGGDKALTYYLAQGQMYFYRTWMNDGITQAGYFTFSPDESKRPIISFSKEDYSEFDPKTVVHDVHHNQGYETGDIFLNINERGHLNMNVGETFKAHAMRTYQLTDNATSNNFIEPDFHYTVIGLDGKPNSGVIEISSNPASSWADIKAVGKGTVIVLVTYDAIRLNYYNNSTKTPYMGGEYWSAIWPENTAAYVITVGENASSVVPNMLINEEYNAQALKVSGQYVDAEHDVFYFLDTEEGAYYTFKPENAVDVTIAYPEFGDNSASYKGFSSDGVTRNDDGSFTLLLKNGRQIVKLTDAQGNSTYQVLRAKPCQYEITNATNPGSGIFQPGDEITVQYSGLFHPANKLAGIYNMTAYITYNGVPNGSSLILGAGQYTFASAPAAQKISVTIPSDYDVLSNPNIEMTNGVIQVNGYGDPVGNHRFIDNEAGRSPNFTAVAHKTYFGNLPEIIVPISEYRSFPITIEPSTTLSELTITYRGKEITADETSGQYSGSYGTYDVLAKADGYRCFRNSFVINDDADGNQIFKIDMQPLDGAWDGKTLTEATLVDGCYQIGTGAELAWYANQVNSGNCQDAYLTADIDLGDFDWTPIGNNSKMFTASFDGKGFTVSGLYIDTPKANYKGLFGYAKGVSANKPSSIKNVTVYGQVSAQQYSAGIVGYIHQNTTIDRCANFANIKGSKTYTGGVVGHIGNASGIVTNCYNVGKIVGTTNCGGVVGAHVANAKVENVFNLGEVEGTKVAAGVGGTYSKTNVKNVFATSQYHLFENHTLVTDEQMASGEVAWLLGAQFGQTIGTHNYPRIDGDKVYKVEYTIISATPLLMLHNEETPSIYTNGELPQVIDSQFVRWYADEAETLPVTKVESDSKLYAKVYGIATEIETIETDTIEEERWFGIDGLEVSKPEPGAHGIYIRIANGKTEKVIL